MIARGTLIGSLLVVGCLLLSACGDDEENLPPNGPIITFFGITRADDVLISPSGTSADGLPVYTRMAGSGIRMVVEGKAGPSGALVGRSVYREDLASFPDLQIEVSRPLGNGSSTVCDPTDKPGGVPGIDPPSFDLTRGIINALNDFGCRFTEGARLSHEDSCVKFPPTDEYRFVNDETTIQFCGFVTGVMMFPPGDTVVTVRLRDVNGNTGRPAQIVIRVQP